MTDQELSTAVAIKLGWSPPGSERAKRRYKEHYRVPDDIDCGGFWVKPDGKSNRRRECAQYATDVKACFDDLVPLILKKHAVISINITTSQANVEWLSGYAMIIHPSTDTIPRAICEAFLRLEG